MRRANHVRQVEQRVFFCRFFCEHVERRASHMAGFQQLGQGDLIDKTATGTVDDAHAFLGLLKVFLGQDVAGAVGQRHVQGDEIGALEQLVKFDLFHTDFCGALFGQEGIVGDHFHFQAEGAVADDAADVAGADHAQSLGGQFDAHELGLFPFACVGRGRCFRDLTGDGEHHCDGVFGSGDHVAEGRVHHDHAFFSTRLPCRRCRCRCRPGRRP